MENGITVENLRKSFPQSGEVFGPVTTRFKENDFISILGPTGCGKSTFLRLLADLEVPTAGKIQTNATASKTSASFVFQEPTLLPWRTVLENVCLPLELKNNSPAKARTQAESALQKVNLLEARDLLPAQLSGGMKMRTSLARAMVTEPLFLFLDEPFSALDEHTRHQMQQNLRDLWHHSKTTVIFVTHSISEAVFLSNRCVVLSSKPGKIITDVAISLPDKRTPELRYEPSFIEQVKKIQQGIR